MMNKEEKQKWLDGLKLGDEVCYDIGQYRVVDYVIRTIDKITPTRRFVVGNLTFDSTGEERGSKGVWSHTKYLQPVTDEIRESVLRNSIMDKIKKFDFKTLDVEGLKIVSEVIDNATKKGEKQKHDNAQ
jgi:hypothetical protein